jgi:tetratricopeptide (TPR) repeat protein
MLQAQIRPIAIDYPGDGSVFPPEFPPPTFIWRDTSNATVWTIEVALQDGGRIRVVSGGEPMRIGEIDWRAAGPTNELPKLSREQASAHTWIPGAETWNSIKRNSTQHPATLTITGYRDASLEGAVSHGKLTLRTSQDPVGAPIFYRDVPLMPAETEKGVIRPLAPDAVPLIAWRLRNVADTKSRVVMSGIYSCANCHSVSRDGRTMGMDLDGPRNDKGLYALFRIQSKTAIRNENIVAWSTFRGKLGGKLRVGFMSQVSPEGRYVVTTIMEPGKAQQDWERRENPLDLVSSYYVANFKDYRFLQVFYPTRGILAWYSAQTGKLQPLAGADDPRYVHTNAVWSPDGKYLVFARAEARDPYPAGVPLAIRANAPNETQIQYDLYRIPFHDGKGGRPEMIEGASRNGMSNSFPKVSPDGRWIVYVQARNGQLMRPDSQLYIVPAAGGRPRRMQCNTPLMNSWHSFSPNGRWLVFSSKSRSPYTQMFLTHIDDDGNDTPAILIENSTAANRAVNIPEFVNIDPETSMQIDAPVTDYFRHVDLASAALTAGRFEAAIPEFKKALEIEPGDAIVLNSLGSALAQAGRSVEAITYLKKAVELSPDYPHPHCNLGSALASEGKATEAVAAFEKALALKPDLVEAHYGLGEVLARGGHTEKALSHLRLAVKYKPDSVIAHRKLALVLAMAGQTGEAILHGERASAVAGGSDPVNLAVLGELYARAGRFTDAAQVTQQALALATQRNNRELMQQLRARLAAYQTRQ